MQAARRRDLEVSVDIPGVLAGPARSGGRSAAGEVLRKKAMATITITYLPRGRWRRRGIRVLENGKLYVELTKVMEYPDVPIKIALESRATNFACWPIRGGKIDMD